MVKAENAGRKAFFKTKFGLSLLPFMQAPGIYCIESFIILALIKIQKIWVPK
jgi:hypothetical protein